ncbi:methylenetetrahydrofolate reductase 2 [Spodoptera litura]|uniref:Methylenetetrahydrofolate reductase 2 n=1 Tax=Spodoptera litura TaxID=69820 RepID=A0A9J7E980_SPOLT|nr:methylenetetrahydrofolate reductase 2 [Spodoptera litura]XP_022826546.1 methylenetetrahydrofolate reductase 2 [Spodoptera litura]XP_022826547.1 methylenetetrahydrofolate reductase 2 [Spodoptera litura]
MAGTSKLTELIQNKGNFSYSFEVTPDVSEEDIDNLRVEPLFFSVTWHAKTHQCKDLNIAPLKIALKLSSKQKNVLLHLSCDMMKTTYLTDLLAMLQENGICNLFLVLGEGFDPSNSDFVNTTEMIKFIREKTGQYFCIGIAGYPGCSDEKLKQIKEKVDAGANFLLTQAFFDVDAFKNLKDSCEKMGVHVPLIPGVFSFETPKQLDGFINMCKIKVSEDLLKAVGDNEKMNRPCTDIIKQLIKQLNSICNITHYHFFTINKLHDVQNLIEGIKE